MRWLEPSRVELLAVFAPQPLPGHPIVGRAVVTLAGDVTHDDLSSDCVLGRSAPGETARPDCAMPIPLAPMRTAIYSARKDGLAIEPFPPPPALLAPPALHPSADYLAIHYMHQAALSRSTSSEACHAGGRKTGDDRMKGAAVRLAYDQQVTTLPYRWFVSPTATCDTASLAHPPAIVQSRSKFAASHHVTMSPRPFQLWYRNHYRTSSSGSIPATRSTARGHSNPSSPPTRQSRRIAGMGRPSSRSRRHQRRQRPRVIEFSL